MSGIKYDSQELWAILRYDWIAVDGDREPCSYATEPSPRDDCNWDNDAEFDSLRGILITDLPADWRQSLRRRPKVWRVPDADTPVDTRVWVRDNDGDKWQPRHYARPHGKVFPAGMTSWSTDGRLAIGYAQILIADGPEPPLDWTPEGQP